MGLKYNLPLSFFPRIGEILIIFYNIVLGFCILTDTSKAQRLKKFST